MLILALKRFTISNLKLKHLIYKIISVLASLWEHSVCTNMAQAVSVEYRAVNKPYYCLPVCAWNYLTK